MYSKYGGTVIKRFAVPLSAYSTAIDVRYKQFPVVILPTSKLYQGGNALQGLETEYKIQLSKRMKYSDLKKRLVDCINA